MLIHDPVTRERFWNESGGICGVYGHPIPLDNAFLERNNTVTMTVGWMAGISVLPEVMSEVGKNEYRDVFSVLKVPDEKIPRLVVSSFDEGILEEDVKFFNKHRQAWLTVLTWTCWQAAGDPELSTEERSYWWAILNKVCNDIFNFQAPKNYTKGETRFVLPAGMWSHPCRVNPKKESNAGWNQINHQLPLNLTDRDLCSPRAIRKVREFLAKDPTQLLFDQEHRDAIQAMPIDVTAPPFLENKVHPEGWSVVLAIKKCIREKSDEVALNELVSVTFERLETTYRAHLVEVEEARTSALEIALAALFVVSRAEVTVEKVRELVDFYGVRDFSSERASVWIDPLGEAAGL